MSAVWTIIDGFLALPVARWLLLVTTAVTVAAALWCRGELGIVRLQRDAAKGQSATYEAHLNIQNAAILKQGAEMENLVKRLKAAQADVEKSREALKKRQAEVTEIVLRGDCPDMVQQVLDEVRK